MNKGLEALKEIKEMLDAPYTSGVIKQGLNVIEKELKALEIIKEKKVMINALIRISFNEYNDYLDRFYLSKERLTKEEYDLLKKVLL